MKKLNKNNKGFSLVELIVVIAIMAVLMAVLVPTLIKNVEKSRLQTDKSALAELRQSVITALADDTFVDCKASTTPATVKDGVLTVANLFDTENKGDKLIEEVEGTIGGKTIKLKSALDTTKDDTTVQFVVLEPRTGKVVLEVNAVDANYDFHITSSGEHSGLTKECKTCNGEKTK